MNEAPVWGSIGDDRGASAVEFALVLPFLLMLVFGMLTGGLTLNDRLGVEQANREAARWAATLPIENCAAPSGTPAVPDDCWFTDVAVNAVLSANGALANGLGERSICVAFIHDDGTDDHSKALRWTDADATPSITNATAAGTECFNDGLSASTAHVQVSVSRPGWINAILFSRSFTMSATSVAVYEPAVPYS